MQVIGEATPNRIYLEESYNDGLLLLMKKSTLFRSFFLTALGMLICSFFAEVRTAIADPNQSEIRVLTIDGVINPLSARYLIREINKAVQDNAQAVILELNTPGGLESSMREMTQSMLNAPIPVIVYVTPHGARAASAGMFITIAANIAAMAPGTNIGAAHPVAIGGGGGEQKSDDVMKEKTVSDAAAFARSIAKERDRNVSWVEQAVRKSVSVAAYEALREKVIDIIATDQQHLLAQLHGRLVKLPSGTRALQTRNIQLIKKPMHFPEKILHAITDPNIAYLLMTIGFIGIIAELYSPGLFFPGITGAISLLLAFAAMGSLPVGWAGLILLLLGIGLLFIETQQPGFGVFGIAGLLAFVLGSLMLYTPLVPVSVALPNVRVSPWVIGGVTSGFFIFTVFVMKSVITARRLPVAMGRATLIGKAAIVMADLSPKGIVKLDQEKWSAVVEPEAESGFVQAGEEVEVIDLEGPILKVRRKTQVRNKVQIKSKQVRNL